MVEIGFEFTAMSCPCEIRLVGPDEVQVQQAAKAGMQEVLRIEHKYSRYRPDSLLSRINTAAGQPQPVPIDEETAGLLQLGGQLHHASQGRFDLTSGVLRRAWDFKRGRVIGPRADGTGWRLGIRDPRDEHKLLGELTLSQGALATSGDYERGFEVDGRRYGHLLDARTGWPVSHWSSVSVAAPNALAAGALATLGMLIGEQARALLEAQGAWYVARSTTNT
jgi:thiamine biosynthesis lipoprotein ApbE